MVGNTVKIGDKLVGGGQPCYVVAEIGINHNGSLKTAKELIKVSAEAGCNSVKFQKRTIDVVYTPEELARPRENPFGKTNGDLKQGLEFGLEEYQEIDSYCKKLGVHWFASCWDEESVDFIEQFDPPCYKIASALLTDDGFLRHHRKFGRPIILSTGMSTMTEIEHAIEVLGDHDLVVLHCTSTYPAKIEELINELKENFTIVIVTHSMQQAARVSQRTAYFHMGRLIEVGDTNQIFTNPAHELTEKYITGRFG